MQPQPDVPRQLRGAQRLQRNVQQLRRSALLIIPTERRTSVSALGAWRSSARQVRWRYRK